MVDAKVRRFDVIQTSNCISRRETRRAPARRTPFSFLEKIASSPDAGQRLHRVEHGSRLGIEDASDR